MQINTRHTFYLLGLQAFLSLRGSLKTRCGLRDSDCHLTFHGCDRQLLKSCFTQMGCCKRHQHFHRCLFNSLQPACTRIRTAARCIVSFEAFRSEFAIIPAFLPHHSVQSCLLPLRVTRTPLGGPVPVLHQRGVDVRPSTGDDLLEIKPLPIYLFTCPNCVWKQWPAGTEASAAARRR
jgi:hypothetical protein